MVEAFMLLVGLLAATFAVLAAWSIARWKAGWRFATVALTLAYSVLIARILVDLSSNPTSHNMWPFEVAIWSALSLAIWGGLALARAIAAPRRVQS